MSAFRCIGCGSVAELDAPDGTLTLGRNSRAIDRRAPTCVCGVKAWVLCGSMTEYYSYTGRADVCRFGEHRDERAQLYTLVPAVRTESAEGEIALASLQVNVCPDHFEQLRTEGFLGFVLPN